MQQVRELPIMVLPVLLHMKGNDIFRFSSLVNRGSLYLRRHRPLRCEYWCCVAISGYLTYTIPSVHVDRDFGEEVRYEETWAYHLGQMFGEQFQVLNYGVGSWCTITHRKAIQRSQRVCIRMH